MNIKVASWTTNFLAGANTVQKFQVTLTKGSFLMVYQKVFPFILLRLPKLISCLYNFKSQEWNRGGKINLEGFTLIRFCPLILTWRRFQKLLRILFNNLGWMRLSRTWVFGLDSAHRGGNRADDKKLAKLKQKEQESTANAWFQSTKNEKALASDYRWREPKGYKVYSRR